MNKIIGIEEARKILNKYLQRKQEFNIFRVLKLENFEIRHSNLLAWLLDPNQTHNIKGAFLAKFTEMIAEKCGKNINYSDKDKVFVYREKENTDILVVNQKQDFLFLIENKIRSKQQRNQLERYKNFAEDNFQNCKNKIYIYLKPENNETIPDDYIFISYKEIIHIISPILETIENQNVKIFLKDYISILNDIYNKIDNISLIDICLKLQQENVKLNEIEQQEILQMAEQRRYEIIKILAEILNESSEFLKVEQKIYKVLFKLKSEKYSRYEFDNTNTRNNSEIKIIKYEEKCPKKVSLFINEDEYNEIFYTYGDDAFYQIKNKLSKHVKNYFKIT